MTLKAHLDFETRSVTNLKKSGVYRYAEDPTTMPWGFRYRIGSEGRIGEWRPGYPDPVDLLNHIASGGIVACHNAAFERTIWNWIMCVRIRPHWPTMTIAQQDCTLSRAAAIAMPQSLDQLGDALHTSLRKDKEGYAVMMKQAKPRRINEDGSVTWWDAPELTDTNMTYCGRDVEVETEADELLPPLSPRNRADWELDQVMNERGVLFDMELAKKAVNLVAYAKKQNDRVMRELTKREVQKCTQDAKIVAWLNGRGIKCTSLAKGEVDDVLFLASAAFDSDAEKVIRLRQAAWKTSTAKYAAMALCVSSDGRVRGLINWHGASTGRRAGRLVQAQNFPRLNDEDEMLTLRIMFLFELLRSDKDPRECYDLMAVVHGELSVLDTLSKALRLMIIAKEGHKLVGGDFSNIEGRISSWLAGETWKLDAFRAYDEGTGPDLYKLAYARSFGVNVEDVGKGPKRQIGKVQELALGFQGSIGAYIGMGANYGVNPYELSPLVKLATTEDQWEATEIQYHMKGVNTFSLQPKEWTALKILVDNWRAANPATVASWWEIQDAAVEAVASPGNYVGCASGKLHYYSDGRYLWLVLPSGRTLCYAEPKLNETWVEYTTKEGETKHRLKRFIEFMGQDSMTKQWVPQYLYGGLQWENAVQAIACDIMVDATFRAEAAGYPIILTVHDELLAEVDERKTHLNAEHFDTIMRQTDAVYEGLPVTVSTWEDKRYVK